MDDLSIREAPVAIEPRIGGMARSTEEEEELQLALAILRISQRLREPRPHRRPR